MKLFHAILLVSIAALAGATQPDPKAVKKLFKGKENKLIEWLTKYLREHAFPNKIGSPRVDTVEFGTVVGEKSLIIADFTATNPSTHPNAFYACAAVIYIRTEEEDSIDGDFIEEYFVFDPKKDLKCVLARDPIPLIC